MSCYGVVKWFGVILLLTCLEHKASALCRWSNEGCSDDSDCCSDACDKPHSGADYRCSKSGVNYPCYADYMCEEGLQCGRKYRCCSPYWGSCDLTEECCDPEHVCTLPSGFTYKRCLYPSSSSNQFRMDLLLLLINFMIVFRIFIEYFLNIC